MGDQAAGIGALGADDESAVWTHAERGGFPVTTIYTVTATTDAMTAER